MSEYGSDNELKEIQEETQAAAQAAAQKQEEINTRRNEHRFQTIDQQLEALERELDELRQQFYQLLQMHTREDPSRYTGSLPSQNKNPRKQGGGYSRKKHKKKRKKTRKQYNNKYIFFQRSF